MSGCNALVDVSIRVTSLKQQQQSDASDCFLCLLAISDMFFSAVGDALEVSWSGAL